MKFYTEEQIINKHIGEKGEIAREKFDAEVQSFLIGEAIKKARQSKMLTQEDLAKLLGVQRAHISKIESGRNITFATICRVFKAMDIKANLDLGGLGKVALW